MSDVRPVIPALATQVGGNHYKDFEIEPLEYIVRNKLSFTQGSVVKYVSRYQFKGGAEDLKKAIHFLQVMLESEYGGERDA